jgi:glycosyltransferase involved in cell wall biosynthesis
VLNLFCSVRLGAPSLGLIAEQAAMALSRHGLLRRVYAPPGLVPRADWRQVMVPIRTLPLLGRTERGRAYQLLTRDVMFDLLATSLWRGDGPVMSLAGMSLATLRLARRHDQRRFLLCGTSHIDYQRAVVTEAKRDAGLEGPPSEFNDRLLDRHRAEYHTAETLVVPSRMAKQTFVRSGIEPERVVVLAHGVDLDRFTPTPLPDRDRLHIVFVGQVGMRKGIHVLLAACARLDPGSFELVLVGDHEPEVPRLLALHPTVPVRLENFQQPVQRYLSAADVLVLPSFEDGFGLVVLEAMAAGRPAVVSDACGASEIVAAEGGGVVYPARDIDRLTEILAGMVADRDHVARLGEEGRRVAEGHPWEIWQDGLAETVADRLGTRTAVGGGV